MEYITESFNGRDDFLDKVKSTMERCIADKSIDAWFFNWAESDRKERTEAEKYISSILPGKWKFVEITGNGTNVGTGWFKNKEYGVTIGLSCNDCIDEYEIEE